MSKNIVTAALVLGFIVGCYPTDHTSPREEQKPFMKSVEEQGWLNHYKRGTDIIQKLSALGPESRTKTDVAAYRGERLAFVGAGAPPGATNDLITQGGFYLRVVTRSGKDLRPRSVWWEVLVCGEVLQVLPENKIIVLEAAEKDWIVLQTG
jgi:hypothetical protein